MLRGPDRGPGCFTLFQRDRLGADADRLNATVRPEPQVPLRSSPGEHLERIWGKRLLEATDV